MFEYFKRPLNHMEDVVERGFKGSLCPYSDGLLFQFILSELLQVHEKVRDLEQSLAHLLLNPIPTSSGTLSITRYLKLPLQPGENLIWKCELEQELSCFTKLKRYAFLFQCDENRRELQALRTSTRKAWLLAVDLCGYACAGKTFKVLAAKLKKITDLLPVICKAITGLIPQFSDDENIVYYLLSHQLQFDALFGEGFTLSQFNLMHGNLKHTTQFLLQSYSHRRFDNLLPLISEKAAALDSML